MTSKALGGEYPKIPHLGNKGEVGDLRSDVDRAFERVEGVISDPTAPKVKFTPEGGLAVLMTNKTGAATVKGTLLDGSTAMDDAFDLTEASDADIIGVAYEDGVADGQEAWVVVAGIADVMLKDSTAATRGNWAKSSDTIGRADATASAPPGLAAAHFQEIGHCIQSAVGGTDVLIRCMLHFN